MKLWYLTALLLTSLNSCSGKPGFMLVGPKVYDADGNDTLMLNLFNVKDDGELQVRIFVRGSNILYQTTVPIEKGEDRVIRLPTTLLSQYRSENSWLEISGTIGDYVINQTAEIVLRKLKPIVFVNTDKPLYKAEDTVKIRILVTNIHLKPINIAKEGEIWITDPNRIKVVQWLNVSFGEGLLHRELFIPKEPPLGQWTVHVKVNDDHHTRIFQVKEYVLPTFEVKIVPPPYVLKSAQEITWKVCAKYTYGKPVRGQLVTNFTRDAVPYWMNVRTFVVLTEIDGCEEVIFTTDERLQLNSLDGYKLDAEVTEEGTGTKMKSSATIRTISYAYTISRQDSDIQFFRPGVPLLITMEVKTPDSKPLPNELINVCMKVKRKKWNEMRTITDNFKVCKNYTSNEQGNVIVTVPPQTSDTLSIDITVEATDHHFHSKSGMEIPKHTFQLKPWYSPSGSYLQIERLHKIDCSFFDADVEIIQSFYYTFSEHGIRKFYYQVMTRGKIVKFGNIDIELSVNNDSSSTDETYLPSYSSESCRNERFPWGNEVNTSRHVGKFKFPIKLPLGMIPKFRILLYTVTDDGEIVSDSVWYDIDSCLSNQVLISFGEKEQSPGSKTNIHLRAEPQSLCSIGVVDKSIYILNEGDLLTGSKVNNKLKEFDKPSSLPSQRTRDYLYCNGGKTSMYTVDAITAFESGGWVVLTDLKLETRPCMESEKDKCPVVYPPPCYRPHGPFPERFPVALNVNGQPGHPGFVELSASGNKPGPVDHVIPPPTPSVTVRTDFPETWLFDLYTIGGEGKLTIEKEMPDSITEWQGSAICIHHDKGLGISDPASIVAFQPFFVSLALPYSVIRNETVPVIVTVFNYLKDCLSISLHLDQTEEFLLYNGTLTKEICVCGGESVTERFHIKFKQLGRVNISIMAATSRKHEVCGNFDVARKVKRSDTIIKPILVEAEGFLKEETKNIFFCMKDIQGDTFIAEEVLRLPAIIVKDSARAFFFLTGDVMGPTLEGLDRLVRLPTGCGEQNMIGLVPNIVVLDYLNATGRITENLKERAIKNIEQGYIREQNYKHGDGSYSAFGNRDKEGSMWLTAFVVRTFASVRRLIKIDEQSLEDSKRWILLRQKSNGCFPMIGTVHHREMTGGVAKDDGTTSALTAYILISILESGEMENNKTAMALQCLEAKHNPTNYSLALFAYAASLAKDPSVFTYLQKLLENAESQSPHIYWKDADKSISIETAGYAILTLLRLDRESDFEKTVAIAKWLTEQRNPYGGFYSTQDTVVALQALGEYGARIGRQELNMELSITSHRIEETFQLNEHNELLTQRIDLNVEHSETNVNIIATGTGCALAQILLRYNHPVPEPSKDFQLSVTAKNSKEDCKKAEIRVCVTYNHPNESNMAIIEIRMISGYVPEKESVRKLLQNTELGIRRYEITENNVNVYFATLTEEIRCFNFDAIQEIEILDAKPANAKVYDYYDNERVVSTSYFIDEECS